MLVLIFCVPNFYVKNKKISSKQEIVSSYLKDKYLIEFDSTEIKNTEIDGRQIKMYFCQAKEGDFIGVKFIAIEDLKTGKITDNYINLKAANLFSDMLKKEYNDDSIALTTIETPEQFFDLENISTYNELINECSDYYIVSYLFVKCDEYSKAEEDKLLNVSKKLSDLKLKDINVVVFYYNNINEADIFNNFYYNEDKYNYFSNNQNLTKRTGFQITNGKVLTDIREEW